MVTWSFFESIESRRVNVEVRSIYVGFIQKSFWFVVLGTHNPRIMIWSYQSHSDLTFHQCMAADSRAWYGRKHCS